MSKDSMWEWPVKVEWSFTKNLWFPARDLERYTTEIHGAIIADVSAADEEDDRKVGTLKATHFRVSQAGFAGIHPFELFDAQSQATYDVYDALYRPGTDVLRKRALEIVYDDHLSYVLAPETMYIEPQYRRRGYGLAAMVALLECFTQESMGLVVIQPAPLSKEGEPRLTETQRTKACERLAKYWTRLGFEHLEGEFFALSSDVKHCWNVLPPDEEIEPDDNAGHGPPPAPGVH